MKKHQNIPESDARCAKCQTSVQEVTSGVCSECGADLFRPGSVLVPKGFRWSRLGLQVAWCAALWAIVLACLIGLLWALYPARDVVRHIVRIVPSDGIPCDSLKVTAVGSRTRPWLLARGDVPFRWIRVEWSRDSSTPESSPEILQFEIVRRDNGLQLVNMGTDSVASLEPFQDVLERGGCNVGSLQAESRIEAIWKSISNASADLRVTHLADHDWSINEDGPTRAVKYIDPAPDSGPVKVLTAFMTLFATWRCSLVVKRHKFKSTSLAQ